MARGARHPAGGALQRVGVLQLRPCVSRGPEGRGKGARAAPGGAGRAGHGRLESGRLVARISVRSPPRKGGGHAPGTVPDWKGWHMRTLTGTKKDTGAPARRGRTG